MVPKSSVHIYCSKSSERHIPHQTLLKAVQDKRKQVPQNTSETYHL